MEEGVADKGRRKTQTTAQLMLMTVFFLRAMASVRGLVAFPCASTFFLVERSEAAVLQTPYLVRQTGESADLPCDQDNNHNYMAWYQQHPWGGLQLLYYSLGEGEEQQENKTWATLSAKRSTKMSFILTMENLQPSDSAVYFCASKGGHVSGAGSVLYFGSGTKVSVIEDGITETTPNVVLFDPSPQEINEKGKATLVCLANRFYPDHVTLSWSVNGVERTAGVKTDDSPTSGDASLYFLSSRLRLSKKEWFRPQNTFRCTVHFHPKNVDISKETKGREDCGVTPDSYRKSANTAKFTYLLLIAKSAFYGLFVTLLVWKMKPGGEKNFT
nr:T cell receptor beta [Andrias davidianus]